MCQCVSDKWDIQIWYKNEQYQVLNSRTVNIMNKDRIVTRILQLISSSSIWSTNISSSTVILHSILFLFYAYVGKRWTI